MGLLKKLIGESKTSKKTSEGVFLPIKVGDIILRGRFRNRKVEVKEITIDEHGLPLINGKNIVNFRFHTPEEETENNDES